MRLDVYLNYRGTCEQAFRFYEQHLGARITGIARHGEMPDPNLSPEWHDKILHARLELGGTVLMGADVQNSEPMRSAYLSLTLESEAEAERVYALLADGGEVFMKMEKTHFANRFAMLRDKFGASWMLLHQPDSRQTKLGCVNKNGERNAQVHHVLFVHRGLGQGHDRRAE
jgi:PhnB protein